MKKLCMCCMEEHEIDVVEVKETNIFKGREVEYTAIYEYCSAADEFLLNEDMISYNDISMKNAYRSQSGLLTSEEIIDIREKYCITQKDLAVLLGWGEKTITRYEKHQVQDMAHDAVLRKIAEDPEWFMELLEKGKDKLSMAAYKRSYDRATEEYEIKKDLYLKKTIKAEYARYIGANEVGGNTKLNFDKIIDVVNYFANSKEMFALYKVKLMKLFWYADFLSFKRHGHSITGMVYMSQKMGALPLAHKTIVNLNGINYEEVEFEDGMGIKFIESEERGYIYLTQNDKDVLDTVINIFGKYTTKEIINKMHKEVAYEETKLNDIIDYKYAETLSIS